MGLGVFPPHPGTQLVGHQLCRTLVVTVAEGKEWQRKYCLAEGYQGEPPSQHSVNGHSWCRKHSVPGFSDTESSYTHVNDLYLLMPLGV